VWSSAQNVVKKICLDLNQHVYRPYLPHTVVCRYLLYLNLNPTKKRLASGTTSPRSTRIQAREMLLSLRS
jgi:hypothetical protein